LEPTVRRAVILATLTFLSLAVAGVNVAQERSFSPKAGYQTEPTTLEVTTGEPTEFVEEGTVENERTVEVTVENFDEPEADELEFTEDEAAEGKGKNRGKPESVSKLAGKGKPPSADKPKASKKVKPQDVGKPEGVGSKPEGAGEPPGKPAGVGKAKGLGGDKPTGKSRAKGGKEEANGGGGQPKVTLCHKNKNTISVGAPAQYAHLGHGDRLGACAQ
jgi:hypothetical protein